MAFADMQRLRQALDSLFVQRTLVDIFQYLQRQPLLQPVRMAALARPISLRHGLLCSDKKTAVLPQRALHSARGAAIYPRIFGGNVKNTVVLRVSFQDGAVLRSPTQPSYHAFIFTWLSSTY